MARSARAIDNLSNRSKRATGTMGLMADRLKLIAGTGLAFGGIAAFGKWVVSIEQFNQAMQSSLAIMGDVSKAMRVDMTAAALQVASVTKFSATEVAQAYFFLASAGLDAAQSIAAMPAVAQFAQAGMFDMSTATSLLTDALSALGRKVKDPIKNLENLVELSDILVTANTLADASVEQFARALSSKAAAKMKVFNIETTEGVAVLAAFAEQGLKAELGGRAFAIVVRDLTRAAVENQKAFEKWNIRVFDDLGGLRKLADVLEDVEKAFGGASVRGRAGIRQELGLPSRSAEFLDALVGSSAGVREFTEELRNAGDKTEDVAESQLSDFAKGMASAGGQLTSMGGAIQPVIDALGRLLQKLGDVPEPAEPAEPAELTGAEKAIQQARNDIALASAQLDTMRARGFPQMPTIFLGSGEKLELRTETEAFDALLKAQRALNELLDEAAGPLKPSAKEIAAIELAAEDSAKKQKEFQEVFEAASKQIQREWKDMESSAESYFANTRTAAERLDASLKEIQLLDEVGIFDDLGGEETVRRAMKGARETFEKAMGLNIKPELPGLPRRGLRSAQELGGTAGALAVSKAATAQNKEFAELRLIRKVLELIERKRPVGMGS